MRVIAYFPDGDESGRKVSTGWRLGERVVSDELTSTSAWFRATHWMPLPNPPAGERREM